jgi:hypothetical protein
MALKWHRQAVWRRAGDPDIFGSGTTYRIFGPGIGKNSPALDISPTNPGGYELWVWSGPAENSPVLGLMGAALRGQRVPCRLCYRSGVRSAPLLRGPPIGSFEPSYARLNTQLGVSEL